VVEFICMYFAILPMLVPLTRIRSSGLPLTRIRSSGLTQTHTKDKGETIKQHTPHIHIHIATHSLPLLLLTLFVDEC
jgi:hypothetical protein